MKRKLYASKVFIIALAFVIAGCTAFASFQLDQLYGAPRVVDRTMADTETNQLEFYRDIKPIVDRRCVVCHGCYDAPCQLKMTSFESLDRGANKDKVYDGTRLLAANLTRMSMDAGTTEQWRKEGFYPVLNEREQTSQANVEAGLLAKMLTLKQNNPLPEGELLPHSFDISLNRDQQCSKIEEFDSFANRYPLWGMPYGLPALEQAHKQTMIDWLKSGAKARFPGKAPATNPLEIDKWEKFFNGHSLKSQLMSRYIFEHLFFANIYFSGNEARIGEKREFFKLVRSKTPPGRAIDIIATRRPFDDPGAVFYYRLQRVKTTILAKQHMPYKLDKARMLRWKSLFLKADYEVTTLPNYKPEVASNPFIAFKELPVTTRYQFMLDEAQYTIMGFIKGPVCRGQVALNVINDHFWVLFIDPELEARYITKEFLVDNAELLRLPAEKDSNVFTPISTWMNYASLEKSYINAKEAQINRYYNNEGAVDLSAIWNGDGHNSNAALTVYRHFDSASVLKGFVGDTPKTGWVIGYSLLERIHYLLVAGFDVYGNVGHQLLTRLYMDFLRMEGEYNFLQFLPNKNAELELDKWYRGAESKVDAYLDDINTRTAETSGIDYQTDRPKEEFFNKVRKQLGNQVIAPDPINNPSVLANASSYQKDLQQLAAIDGAVLNYFPEQSVVRVELDSGEYRLLSLLKNRAHSNVSHLFGERYRLIPEEQTLSVVEGVIGSYPNVFFNMKESDLSRFTRLASKLKSDADYYNLVTEFGIRRTNKEFWRFSDAVHDLYLQASPVEAGYLDYNRVENR